MAKTHLAADSTAYEVICGGLSHSGTSEAKVRPALINGAQDQPEKYHEHNHAVANRHLSGGK